MAYDSAKYKVDMIRRRLSDVERKRKRASEMQRFESFMSGSQFKVPEVEATPKGLFSSWFSGRNAAPRTLQLSDEEILILRDWLVREADKLEAEATEIENEIANGR